MGIAIDAVIVSAAQFERVQLLLKSLESMVSDYNAVDWGVKEKQEHDAKQQEILTKIGEIVVNYYNYRPSSLIKA